MAWWHLHWPREARLFEEPRILAVQMSREPRFAYAMSPAYVGFSVNVISTRADVTDTGLWTLESLLPVLNSSWAVSWFETHGKQRGVNLDITGGTLKQFPLPEITSAVCDELTMLGRRRIHAGTDRGSSSSASHLSATVEDQIDRTVDQLFGG
jgi:hypothetical protein